MAELYYNAKVYVEKGHYEQAVLVEDGIIRRIGSSDALLSEAPADAVRVDCGGRTLIPGLNDSHMHFAQFSETLNQAHIADVKSIGELIEVCRKFAQEHNPPTAYNRLALMAVSVFHLSHWRLDVTVCNYILAV